MTRRWPAVAVLTLLVCAHLGCGKVGPPVRHRPAPASSPASESEPESVPATTGEAGASQDAEEENR